MILLGLQTLKLLPSFGRFAPVLPKRFVRIRCTTCGAQFRQRRISVGGLTVFLPCRLHPGTAALRACQGQLHDRRAHDGGLCGLARCRRCFSLSALSTFARGSFQRHFLKFAGVAMILLGFLNVQYGLVLAGSNLGPVATVPTPAISTAAPAAVPAETPRSSRCGSRTTNTFRTASP